MDRKEWEALARESAQEAQAGGIDTENLEVILRVVYDVSAADAPAEAVLWAAALIKEAKHAYSELQRINVIRAKRGKPLVFAPYGHHAF